MVKKFTPLLLLISTVCCYAVERESQKITAVDKGTVISPSGKNYNDGIFSCCKSGRCSHPTPHQTDSRN